MKTLTDKSDFLPGSGCVLIYLITDGELTIENFNVKKTETLDLIKAAVQKEISLIQIREKSLPARMIYELTAEAVRSARGSRTKILVNDRADIALAANADGVHLTDRSLSADVIHRFSPKKLIVGVSTHTLAEAAVAKEQNADFATLSPIFHSPGKGEPKNPAFLREVCRALKPFPVLALGGINETNYESVIANGAGGIAAIRFLKDRLQNLAETA